MSRGRREPFVKGNNLNTTIRTTTRLGTLLAFAAAALSGCAAGEAPAAEEPAAAGDVVTISDAWVKSAEEGMSAAFGELVNSGTEDVTVVSATTEASSMLELHETVENEAGAMVMRQIEGGFVLPAGGTLPLEPGGDHIMLMDLTAPLHAGEEVTFTLMFSDHSTYEFTAPVKDYSGANETYQDGESHPGHMDMGDE